MTTKKTDNLIDVVVKELSPMYHALGGGIGCTGDRPWKGTKHYGTQVILAIANWCDRNIESYGYNTLPQTLRDALEE